MTLLDMRFGLRIALAFGGAIATTLALVGTMQLRLTQSAANADAMSESVQWQAKAAEVHLDAKENAIASLVTLVSASPDQQAKLAKEIKARDEKIAAGLGALDKALAGSSSDQALIAEARKRHATFVAGVQRIVGMVQAGKQSEATFAADEEMLPMMAPFLGALDKLDRAQLAKVEAIRAANADLVTRTRWCST